MSRTRRSFTTEYKVEAAHRVIDSGRTIAEVGRELGVNEGLLGRLVADEQSTEARILRSQTSGAKGTRSRAIQQRAAFRGRCSCRRTRKLSTQRGASSASSVNSRVRSSKVVSTTLASMRASAAPTQ